MNVSLGEAEIFRIKSAFIFANRRMKVGGIYVVVVHEDLENKVVEVKVTCSADFNHYIARAPIFESDFQTVAEWVEANRHYFLKLHLPLVKVRNGVELSNLKMKEVIEGTRH